ncbi:right-handed parallel beta-helix repeat-containing protein, partial [uncultured Methanobrevibacter sp.]|uniref:right-handed parallel beta-helix repeat-containing protein n=1 Tax=uncultured Methanobrevibacter sp. TaxID=253161 RepID=UPI002636FCE3
MGVVSANDNTTQTLTENSVDTTIDNGKTFTDIQKQIDAAGENATIEIEGNYTSEGKEIKIDKSLTITSKNGATLNANQKSAIFNISNVNVCLKNLNFINSKSGNASAICNQGNLTIINASFINNTVHDPRTVVYFDMDFVENTAGAIHSTNNLNLINCEFENNYAVINGWEHEYFYEYLISLGGSIYSKGTLSIDRSRFKDDPLDSFGNLTILNSEFISSGINCYEKASIINSIFTKHTDYRSAIRTSSDLNVTGCNFTDNGGYAIYSEHEGDTIIINRCNFINNNLKCAGCYDYETDEDELNSESPTLYFDGPNVYVYNSNFINNTASAIDSNNDGTLYVLNSSFSKNSANVGGAICASNATVINSTFTDNYAYFAGAIYANRLFLQNCNFTNNNEAAIGIGDKATINNQSYTGHKYFNNSMSELVLITASVGKLTTTYQSGKTLWAKFIYTETKHPVKNNYADMKIIKGKKVYYDDVWINTKGIANYKASNLAVGTYKIIFNYNDRDLPQITTTVKITKAKTIIKAPKVTNKYKRYKQVSMSKLCFIREWQIK